MSRKLTTQEFIQKAILIHGDKYNYSLTVYEGRNSRIKIICPEHGLFEQIVDNHLKGKGCKKCGINERTETITHSKEKFINKANLIHGNRYNYSNVIYANSYTKIEIICNIHGSFQQLPSIHLNGYGCKICSGNNQKTTEEFISKAKIVHGDKYDYSISVYTNTKGLVDILCPDHGVFKQRADLHLLNRGCPVCNEPKGEKEIRKFLTEHKIEFHTQKKFDDCKRLHNLKFDFYLPEFNTCIEYNGQQHYKPIDHFGGQEYFLLIQERDSIKQEFCKTNNIKLFIIKYDDNILDSLRVILNELHTHSLYLQHRLKT